MSYPSEVCKRVNFEWTMAEVIRKKGTIGLSRETGCIALKKLSLKHACHKKKKTKKIMHTNTAEKKIHLHSVSQQKKKKKCYREKKYHAVHTTRKKKFLVHESFGLKDFVPIPNHPPPSQKARGPPLIASVLLYCAL